MPGGLGTLFLAGDVMTGRGVDQILPRPGDPRLWERDVRDSRTYVELAEAVNGPIPQPVAHSWIWGDALRVLDDVAPDIRIVNLETSITRSEDVAAGKAVHYRMSPDNVGCLSVAHLDAVALANNHLLDFGGQGLEETLRTLADVRIRTVGAGRNASEAARPAVIRGVVVFSFGMESSGIPPSWAATGERPGVDLVSDPTPVVERVARTKRPGTVVVASVHWGGNWGYDVSREQVDFAHRLIDSGVDIVHGHSSHHPRPIEIYRDRLILYGCGDLVDDYEGIGGFEKYRGDLRLLYFVSVDTWTGRLARLWMAPMQARQMRLRHASSDDCAHLCAVLGRISRPFGSHVEVDADGMLALSAG